VAGYQPWWFTPSLDDGHPSDYYGTQDNAQRLAMPRGAATHATQRNRGANETYKKAETNTSVTSSMSVKLSGGEDRDETTAKRTSERHRRLRT